MQENKMKYWKGLDDLNPSPEKLALDNREFAEDLPLDAFLGDMGIKKATPRRDFLKTVGFGISAATLAACNKAPIHHAIPYLVKPEEVTLGIPNFYTSNFNGYSILVKTREGRPIKIEGNPACPIAKGSVDSVGQASVLSLYDNERLKGPVLKGNETSWPDIDDYVGRALRQTASGKGTICLLTESINSPSTNAVIAAFGQAYPGVRVVSYDPVSYSAITQANKNSFDREVVPSYRFDRADVIVSFAADFLGSWISPVEYTKQYVSGRNALQLESKKMSRHIQFESGMSLTGANADHRYTLKPSQHGTVLLALYNAIAAKTGSAATPGAQNNQASFQNTGLDQSSLDKTVAALLGAKGRSLVVSGSNDVSIQILVNAINSALGSYGTTIDLDNANLTHRGNDAQVMDIVGAMSRGEIETIIFYGSNPVYNYPQGNAFKTALKRVKNKISLAQRLDETAKLCDAVAPDQHYLENWGDVQARTNLYAIVQPVINPIFDSRAGQQSLLNWAFMSTGKSITDTGDQSQGSQGGSSGVSTDSAGKGSTGAGSAPGTGSASGPTTGSGSSSLSGGNNANSTHVNSSTPSNTAMGSPAGAGSSSSPSTSSSPANAPANAGAQVSAGASGSGSASAGATPAAASGANTANSAGAQPTTRIPDSALAGNIAASSASMVQSGTQPGHMVFDAGSKSAVRPQTWYDFLKYNWEHTLFPQCGLTGDFTGNWETLLKKGFIENAPAPAKSYAFSKDLTAVEQSLAHSSQTSAGKLEIEVYQSVNMRDGKYSNNPWLLELPDPVTKVTWDNYLAISLRTAHDYGLRDGDWVKLRAASLKADGTNEITVTVLVQPGQAYGAASIAAGFGRTAAGKAGNAVGYNAYPFVHFANGSFQYNGAIELVKGEGSQEYARTQDHDTIEGRDMTRETILSEYVKNPSAGSGKAEKENEENKPDVFYNHPKKGHHWGMSIDLNACTGCNACIVACIAENNIAVVGKKEVHRRREMHWIRIDRYYSFINPANDKAYTKESEIRELDKQKKLDRIENVSVFFQPMLCQQCDHAPCETVCPVLATMHSSEGLSQQVYNRCFGTRYCANNCPYKVRRFNWFKYFDNDQFDYHMNDDLGKMVLNPDVTVRSRGVMEKCSFCVQRIQAGKLAAKIEGAPLQDGAIQTACQQTCPANAIIFGDINDRNSQVSKLLQNERTYYVLEELGVEPGIGYMTKVRNRDMEYKEANPQSL